MLLNVPLLLKNNSTHTSIMLALALRNRFKNLKILVYVSEVGMKQTLNDTRIRTLFCCSETNVSAKASCIRATEAVH